MTTTLDLESRVRALLAEESAVRRLLVDEGPQIVDRLCRLTSMRKAAKAADLSQAYLWLVRSGSQPISPESFLELCDVERQLNE